MVSLYSDRTLTKTHRKHISLIPSSPKSLLSASLRMPSSHSPSLVYDAVALQPAALEEH